MLLTRSPLSFYFRPRRFFHKNHVRLACVKHAASVRPEPGSNSLLKVRLLSLTFLLHQIIVFLCTLKVFITVYFSWFIVTLTATLILYHLDTPLSTLFFKIFKNIFKGLNISSFTCVYILYQASFIKSILIYK